MLSWAEYNRTINRSTWKKVAPFVPGNETSSSHYTVVTFTLSRVDNGTRLRLVHSGFVLPKNEIAYTNMGGGWKKVVPRIGEIAGEQQDAPKNRH